MSGVKPFPAIQYDNSFKKRCIYSGKIKWWFFQLYSILLEILMQNQNLPCFLLLYALLQTSTTTCVVFFVSRFSWKPTRLNFWGSPKIHKKNSLNKSPFGASVVWEHPTETLGRTHPHLEDHPRTCKWLVTPIYKPFRPFIRGITPVRGLTITMVINHLQVLGWSSKQDP